MVKLELSWTLDGDPGTQQWDIHVAFQNTPQGTCSFPEYTTGGRGGGWDLAFTSPVSNLSKIHQRGAHLGGWDLASTPPPKPLPPEIPQQFLPFPLYTILNAPLNQYIVHVHIYTANLDHFKNHFHIHCINKTKDTSLLHSHSSTYIYRDTGYPYQLQRCAAIGALLPMDTHKLIFARHSHCYMYFTALIRI